MAENNNLQDSNKETINKTTNIKQFDIVGMGRDNIRTTESHKDYSTDAVEKTKIVENLRKKIEKSPAVEHLIEIAFTDDNGNIDRKKVDKILNDINNENHINNKVEFVKISTLLNEFEGNGIDIQDKYKKEFAKNLFSDDKKETLSYENFAKYIKENGTQQLSYPCNFIIEDENIGLKDLDFSNRFPDDITELNNNENEYVTEKINKLLEDNTKRTETIKNTESLNKFYDKESDEIVNFYNELYKNGVVDKSISPKKIFRSNIDNDKREYQAIKNNPMVVKNLTAIQNSDMYRELYKAKYGRYPDSEKDSIYNMDVDITKFYRLTTTMLQYIHLTCDTEEKRKELLEKLQQFMEKERINIGKNGGKIDMDEILARFDKEFKIEEQIDLLLKQRDDSIDIETGNIDENKFTLDNLKQLNWLKNIKDLKNIKAISNGTGEDMVCHMTNEFYRNNQQEKYRQRLNNNEKVVGKEINRPLSSIVSALTSKKLWGVAAPEAITMALGVIFPPAMIFSVGTFLSLAHRKSEPVLFYKDVKKKNPYKEKPQVAKIVKEDKDKLQVVEKNNDKLNIVEKHNDKLNIVEKNNDKLNIVEKHNEPNIHKEEPNVFKDILQTKEPTKFSVVEKNNINNLKNDIDKLNDIKQENKQNAFGSLNMNNLKNNIVNGYENNNKDFKRIDEPDISLDEPNVSLPKKQQKNNVNGPYIG